MIDNDSKLWCFMVSEWLPLATDAHWPKAKSHVTGQEGLIRVQTKELQLKMI